MNRAVLSGRLELRPVRRMFHSSQWQAAVGSSGTIKSIERVVIANGWSEEGINKSSLKRLRRALIGAIDSSEGRDMLTKINFAGFEPADTAMYKGYSDLLRNEIGY